jgi:hypothetical protein
MSVTARELADQVIAARKAAWDKSSPAIPVVSTEQLNPEDEVVARRMVEAAGFRGPELDEMVRKVTHLMVGRVEALADHQPAVNGD